MAKALKTRQKLVFRTDGLRPRNPISVAARTRPGAGAHQKGAGATRQQAQRELRTVLKADAAGPAAVPAKRRTPPGDSGN